MKLNRASKYTDEERFRKYYEETYLKYLYTAKGILKKQEDAEEIVEEVYLKILEKDEIYAKKSKEELYALGIVMIRNACINLIHERERHEEIPIELHGDVLEGEEDLLKGILSREREKIVKEAILMLSEKERSVLLLRYFEEMSYQEIAENLKIKSKTVEVRLRRAKKHLKKYLEEVMGDEKI